jgi:hypothetical protein
MINIDYPNLVRQVGAQQASLISAMLQELRNTDLNILTLRNVISAVNIKLSLLEIEDLEIKARIDVLEALVASLLPEPPVEDEDTDTDTDVDTDTDLDTDIDLDTDLDEDVNVDLGN